MLVGVFCLAGINVRSLSDYFKEHFALNVVLEENASEAQAAELCKKTAGLGYVGNVKCVSRREGTDEMKEMLGSDFLKLFDVNPIPISMEVSVKANYFQTDSLEKIKKSFMSEPLVEDVYYQESMVDALNKNLGRIGAVVLVFVLLLMFISLVLINNTVRLNVFSKRFSIYTMRLVGATRGFIRGPFLVRAIFQGLIAGLIAVASLMVLIYYVGNEFSELFSLINTDTIMAVFAGVVLLGVLICVCCTFFVINKIVSLRNDDLYY